MATENSLDARKKKLVDFLSEDFHDTALHLRDTDRKIEFTFQIFAGGFSLISSITISIFAYTFGNETLDRNINKYILLAILFLLMTIWLFTCWAFFYSVKGTKNESYLY